VALKPDHPFNAKYLHENLLNREIQDRDHLWTLYLNRRWDPENTTQLVRIVEWAGELEDEEPGDEVKVLSSIILSWLFTSSNRFVRDRATKALTNLLDDDFEIWKKVVNQFQGRTTRMYLKEYTLQPTELVCETPVILRCLYSLKRYISGNSKIAVHYHISSLVTMPEESSKPVSVLHKAAWLERLLAEGVSKTKQDWER